MHKTREALDAQQEALHINSSLLNKIIEILRSETFNTTDEAGNADIVISKDDFNSIAERIIKLLDSQNVSNLAKFCKRISQQEDCPPEFVEIVNKEFWNLI